MRCRCSCRRPARPRASRRRDRRLASGEAARTVPAAPGGGGPLRHAVEARNGAIEDNGRVGLIGYGIMGAAMAPLLADAGHAVHVYDVDPVARERARRDGHSVAESPSEVGAAVPVTLVSLPRPQHVHEVVQGPGGLLSGTADGAIIVDTSTVDPATTRANAAAAADVGVGYLDAPVLGRPDAAGRWTLPVGGEEEHLRRVEPLLRVIAARVVHVGPSGHGNILKLLNNLMFGAINGVTGEVFALAERVGMPVSLFFDTVADSGAATVSGLFRQLGPKVVSGDFEPNVSVDNLEKDISLGLAMAAQAGVTLEVGEAARRLHQRAQAAGLGDLDTAAVVRVAAGASPETA